MIKTMQGWTDSQVGDWDKYAKSGDEVDSEVYYYFLEVLPPATMKGGMFQVGEPYNHVNGVPTYATFYETNNNQYFYWGHITKAEAITTLNNLYQVTRDNKTLYTGTEPNCYEWLLNHQSQSTDWAIKYEGYKIEKV